MSLFVQKSPLTLYRRLPLLTYTSSLFQNVNFEKTLVICVQHLLRTTYALFHVLFEMGLKPSNIAVLGKCYSTDPFVFNQLKEDGVDVCSSSMLFDSHASYDKQFDQNVDQFLSRTLRNFNLNDYEKIIVLDDGGHLLEGIHRLHLDHPQLFSIEQTSAGYNRIKDVKVNFPVINLARAWSKLSYETPMIINRCLQRLNDHLDKLALPNTELLILGKGNLGKHVADSLENRFKIAIYDINQSKSSISSNQLVETIANSDVILGCTGTISISKEMHKYIRPSTTLVSISSSDREFDAVWLRRQALPENNCHQNLIVNGVHLLNCGFPINFDDNYLTVDSDDFQFTRSLILASLAQAQLTQRMSPGFYDLDHTIQSRIVKKFDFLRNKVKSLIG